MKEKINKILKPTKIYIIMSKSLCSLYIVIFFFFYSTTAYLSQVIAVLLGGYTIDNFNEKNYYIIIIAVFAITI